MTMSTDRGTGRTQRMLEEAAAYNGPATVVADRQAAAAELQRRMIELLGERVKRHHLGVIDRTDGERIVFVLPQLLQMRGRPGRIFVDHYVHETVNDPQFWTIVNAMNARAAEIACDRI